MRAGHHIYISNITKKFATPRTAILFDIQETVLYNPLIKDRVTSQ